jgi:short-subunit dehydrogenase
MPHPAPTAPSSSSLVCEGAKISVLDVSSVESIQTFTKMIDDTAIDVLINNAGM